MINTKVDDRKHAPNNLTNYYMINLIQSLPSPLPTAGNYSHMSREVMEGGWSGDGDDDGDDLPSREAKSASRLALPRKNNGWRRLRDGFWKSDHFLEFRHHGNNRSQSRAPGEGPVAQAA